MVFRKTVATFININAIVEFHVQCTFAKSGPISQINSPPEFITQKIVFKQLSYFNLLQTIWLYNRRLVFCKNKMKMNLC